MYTEANLPQRVRDRAKELTDFYRGLDSYSEQEKENKRTMAAWQKTQERNVLPFDSLTEAVSFYCQHPDSYAIFVAPGGADGTGYCAIESEGWVKALFAGYRAVIHEAYEDMDALKGAGGAVDEIEEV